MGMGFLSIELFAGEHDYPVTSNDVKILQNGNVLHILKTDENGKIGPIELEAPCLAEHDGVSAPCRATFDVIVDGGGKYKRVEVHGVQIFDGLTSHLPVKMFPLLPDENRDTDIEEIFIPYEHGVDMDKHQEGPSDMGGVTPEGSVQAEQTWPLNAILVNDIALPDFVTVHLAHPSNTSAPNVRVPFRDYIKNVASSEIYPTWEDAALRANILCHISFILNRIYTTWYRSRGRNFDITNSTAVDQFFVNGREIFGNISQIVDEIFNNFLRRQGRKEPFFAEYCSGRSVTCPGLHQWGSQELALRGFSPIQILHHYYPRDLQIQYTNRFFTNVSGSYPGAYPGTALREGSSGENVRLMQMYLNRISGNWFIPPIPNPNGFFGPETTRTVTEFQRIFRLATDGVIGRATWYEIIRVFVAAKSLAELTSEGNRIGIQNPPPTAIVRMGDRGENVVKLQFVLAYLGEFFSDLPLVIRNGVFRENTRDAVIAFQRKYNLNVDGIVGPITWRKLWEVYFATEGTVPPQIPGQPNIPAYPGVLLRQGSRGSDVALMQSYLNAIRKAVPSITALAVDGIFGPVTHSAVVAFQRHFGLTPDGIIGPITWYRIVDEFNNLQNAPGPGPGPTPNPPYPGSLIRVGSRGADVSLIQTRLNAINRVFPAIPTLAADGIFGPLTEGAVIAFQRIFGLSADGIVGPITWERLMNVSGNLPTVSNPVYPGVLISVGSRGPSVTVMQNYLNTIRSRLPSIPQLAADGIFGPITQNAVTTFQNLMGISSNGIIGPITWNYIVSVRNAVNMGTRAASVPEHPVIEKGANTNNIFGLMLALSMFKGRNPF